VGRKPKQNKKKKKKKKKKTKKRTLYNKSTAHFFKVILKIYFKIYFLNKLIFVNNEEGEV